MPLASLIYLVFGVLGGKKLLKRKQQIQELIHYSAIDPQARRASHFSNC